MLTDTDTINLNIALPHMHGWDHAVLGAAHPKRYWDPTNIIPIALVTTALHPQSPRPVQFDGLAASLLCMRLPCKSPHINAAT